MQEGTRCQDHNLFSSDSSGSRYRSVMKTSRWEAQDNNEKLTNASPNITSVRSDFARVEIVSVTFPTKFWQMYTRIAYLAVLKTKIHRRRSFGIVTH